MQFAKRFGRKLLGDEAILRTRRAYRALATENKTAGVHDWITHYAQSHGAIASLTVGRPLDAQGDPLPWFTYPSIEFLAQLDLSGARVFEYGSGNGSRYWSMRCFSAVSVESDPTWYRIGLEQLSHNQVLLLHTDAESYVNAINPGQYDVIVIDGRYRYDCAIKAIEHLSDHGVIVFDNSDWFPNTCSLLAQHGLLQVDFIGPGPLNSYAWCTSLFFKRSFALPRKTGGTIKVLDGLIQQASGDCSVIRSTAKA